MGDHKEDAWRKKLSFMPSVKIGQVGSHNLAKLQRINQQLVEAVRLRGGGRTTKKHKRGQSVGRTVGQAYASLKAKHPGRKISGTVQLSKGMASIDSALQVETIATITACIEEAFGSQNWYKATKECFEQVPSDRRLPGGVVPGSCLWWSWKGVGETPPDENPYGVHIDDNAVPPCFVLCPHTYNGAELLLGECNQKIPMQAGRVVGGAWHRFPHCNDTLYGDEDRYSFVVYFDYRMLNPNYMSV